MPLTRSVPDCRRHQVADQPEQSRLATAGRPDQGDEVAGWELEVDASQGLDVRFLPEPKTLPTPLRLDDERIGSSSVCLRLPRTQSVLGERDQTDEDDAGQPGDDHRGEQLLGRGGELLGELEQVAAQTAPEAGR